MGNSASSSGNSDQNQELKDIKHLGDRVPFGDAELVHIYRSYQLALSKPKDSIVSFLTDFAVAAASLSSPEESDERLVLLQAIEHKILPPNFGNRLYKQCLLRPSDISRYDDASNSSAKTTVDEYDRVASLEKFFEGVANCGRRGNKHALLALFRCCKIQEAPATTGTASSSSTNGFAYAQSSMQSSKKVNYIDPHELVDMGYRIGLAAAFFQAAADDDDMTRFLPGPDVSNSPELKAFSRSLLACASRRRGEQSIDDGHQYVSEEDVLEWGDDIAPMFATTLSTFFHSFWFPGRAAPPSRSSFDFPSIPSESSFFRSASSPLLFSFSCMSVSLGGEFYRIYTSSVDGLSFNRLQNSLLGYGGPTLLIIRSGNCIFGAFTASPWKETKDFYGNSDCFLYQALPTAAVYRPTGSSTNYMYCNSRARSKGYDQQAHGIGFGGNTDQPRLFIAENFDDCRAANNDMTFENGAMLSSVFPTDRFDIDELEVWGVGGTEAVQEALGARYRQREIQAANIRKAQKVDKAAFLDDFRSGLIESKAFAHQNQIRGREDACVDPDDPKNYIYPGEKGSTPKL